MRQLLTKKEAAARLRIHPESLMRLCRQGKFPPPIKIGDLVRFDEAAIDGWLTAQTQEYAK